MIVLPWVETVGYAAYAPCKEYDCLIHADDPLALRKFLQDRFNIKQHDAAAMFKWNESRHYVLIRNLYDIPMYNVYCVDSSKPLIQYSKDEDIKSLVRIFKTEERGNE